jgi:hypothetical protein
MHSSYMTEQFNDPHSTQSTPDLPGDSSGDFSPPAPAEDASSETPQVYVMLPAGDELLTVARSLQLLEREFERGIIKPPGGDPCAGAFCEAARESLKEGDEYSAVLLDIVKHRQIKSRPRDPGVPAPQVANIAPAITRTFLLEGNPGELFEAYGEPEAWREANNDLAAFLRSDDPRTDMFSYLIASANLSTTDRRRAGPLSAYLQIRHAHEDLPDDTDILDVGSSVLVVPNQLARTDEIPLSPVTITSRPRLRSQLQPDEAATEAFNDVFNRRPFMQHIIGIDPMDPTDPVTAKFVRGSYRIKGELNNPNFMRTHDQLSHDFSERLGYARADFTSPKGMEEFEKKYPGQKFDIFLISMVGNQLARSEFENMISMARHYGKDENARILLQDLAHLPNDRRRGTIDDAEFYLDWHGAPYRCRLFEIDPFKRTVDEVLRSVGTRCNEIQLTGQLAIGGRPMSTRKALLEAFHA